MQNINITNESSEIDDIIKISQRIIDPRDIESVNGETCWSHSFRSIAIRPRTYCCIKAMRSAMLPNMVDVVEAAVDQLWNSSFGGKQ